jgi:hypothetical protein
MGPSDTGIWPHVGVADSSPSARSISTGETAETAVIQAGPTYKLLANNSLDGTYTLSTPESSTAKFSAHGDPPYCISR